MLEMEDMALLLHRRMELFLERRLLSTEKGLGNTAILIMMGRPSLSATLLARMGSES